MQKMQEVIEKAVPKVKWCFTLVCQGRRVSSAINMATQVRPHVSEIFFMFFSGKRLFNGAQRCNKERTVRIKVKLKVWAKSLFGIFTFCCILTFCILFLKVAHKWNSLVPKEHKSTKMLNGMQTNAASYKAAHYFYGGVALWRRCS